MQAQLTAQQTRIADVQRTFADSGIDNPALLTRAINENWTPDRTARELLPMVRSRSQSVGADAGHLGIHVARGADVNALSAALLLREGLQLDHGVFESSFATRSSIPLALRQSINSDNRQMALETAHQYETTSLVDLCRMALVIDGRPVPSNRDEMIRAATSTHALQTIFSVNVSARLLASYMDADDTTPMWTQEEDVANFQSNERHTMGKFGKLTKHARGKTADHMDTDAVKEQYKIARFSGQTFTDEMDIIDDRLGGLDDVSPEDMGLAARQLRPDLCYAELLANGTLASTDRALFHEDQNNLFPGATFDRDGIARGLTAMKTQRIKERVLNLMLKYLLIPCELEFIADQLLHSAEITQDGGKGSKNYLQKKGLVAISEDRLGPQGVIHPDTGVQYTGSASDWYGLAQPGRNGAKTMVVGFLRGTGRAPQINTYTRNDGCWGVGHAVKMDIGVKPLDFRGFQKHVA